MTTRLVWWFVSVAVLAGACRRKSPEAPVQPAGATVPEKHPHEDQHEELPRVIKLSPLVLREAKIATAPAEKRKLAATIDLNGQIAPNPDAIAQVSSRVSGRILRVLAKEGDRVRPGQLLLVVVSPELARMRAEYAGTRAKTKAARQNAERLRSLFEQRLGAEQDAATAEAEAAALEAERDEDARALRGMGVALDAPADPAELAITSSMAGEVVQRDAAPGQVVGPERTLMTVADLSQAYFQAQLFEKDLAKVREGAPAEVRLNGYPDEVLPARVARIAAQVDPQSRTLTARLTLDNPGAKVRLGLFGTARVSLPAQAEGEQVVVPLSAVTEIGEKKAVFVRQPDGDFEMHEVTLGTTAGGFTAVLAGLQPGEQVVVSGTHTLKSAVLKSTMGEEE